MNYDNIIQIRKFVNSSEFKTTASTLYFYLDLDVDDINKETEIAIKDFLDCKHEWFKDIPVHYNMDNDFSRKSYCTECHFALEVRWNRFELYGTPKTFIIINETIELEVPL